MISTFKIIKEAQKLLLDSLVGKFRETGLQSDSTSEKLLFLMSKVLLLILNMIRSTDLTYINS